MPAIDQTTAVDQQRRMVLAALASLWVPAVGCRPAPRAAPPAMPSVPAPAGVAALGRRYLDEHPEEEDRAELQAALGLSGGPERAFIARVGEAMGDDLDAGRVVEVEGWQLTLTECRLYALVALS